ncbi:uncharacterized protein LOC123695812 isoform X2 [Colias croceus]|uniref:uncharacterized protein LOC123695812 isoform X2 n=1 Tax=Colias crocea TaxID=72248 RepID=UPI001E27AFFF|nr:uncharacterized protein LOC123695812 isoform X2 [Colias croceus]
MGSVPSSQVKDSSVVYSNSSWMQSHSKETVLAALNRIEEEIANSEKQYPMQRHAVVMAELKSIEIELKEYDIDKVLTPDKEFYAKTMHQVIVGLDLYRCPLLAAENEDFIANVNRKEMRRFELKWLKVRQKELERESQLHQTRMEHLKTLHTKYHQLLEIAVARSKELRDALASVSVRLRAAADYVQNALRLLDDALPAWKMASIGKSGWERTQSCAHACSELVNARCLERSARRVLVARAAPRAARTFRLALDYAFTDTFHDHRYQRATETIVQFKKALIQLVSSIHKVLLNNVDNLVAAEKDLVEKRRELRALRVNTIIRQGLAEMQYMNVDNKTQLNKCF